MIYKVINKKINNSREIVSVGLISFVGISAVISYKALIEQADYFSEDKMQYLRKKVLDMGNDNIRSNDDDLEKFTIEFEFNK